MSSDYSLQSSSVPRYHYSLHILIRQNPRPERKEFDCSGRKNRLLSKD